MIPLEDNFNDIIGKAMRGLGFTADSLAAAAGIGADAIRSLVDGQWNAGDARAIAPHLGLGPVALVESGDSPATPPEISIEGLEQYNTPFDDMMVNSYLLWKPGADAAVAFDTGADCQGMLDTLKKNNLRLGAILLTHTHGDHIYDLDRLKSKTGAPAYVGNREPFDGAESFEPGRTFQIGGLDIETRLTWGHSMGGITYLVRGLSSPVAIDGDAVFAGSMGGGGVSYADALHTNIEEILTLPEDTVICSGHGPMTTVAHEKQHNPFFAA